MSTFLKREKRKEQPHYKSTLSERNLGIRQRVDTWIKSARFLWNNVEQKWKRSKIGKNMLCIGVQIMLLKELH